MAKNDNISIAGRNVELKNIPEKDLKGITLGDKLSYNFYEGEYRGVTMVFLKPKGKNPSPRNCALTSDRLSLLLGKQIVFLINPAPSYERQRLFDKDVYFVMSDKYANLPMTILMERVSSKKEPVRLTPVAQYILLYHLQISSLNGLSIKEISKFVPYSYASVAIGVTCLCDLGLCEKEQRGQRAKAAIFNLTRSELWAKAAAFAINPVERNIFCDGIKSDKHFPICGINALSHYTMLNPDKERWVAMTRNDYLSLAKDSQVINPNTYDGEMVVEIWKYPPIKENGTASEYVDKLSLALSLTSDEDPRVEIEVERMMNEIEW